LKLEKSLSIFCDRQSGHWMPLSDDPKTNFSNSDSQLKHLYSKIGMVTSAYNAYGRKHGSTFAVSFQLSADYCFNLQILL